MTTVQHLRMDAREIFTAGVQSADPAAAVRRALDLREGRLRVEERSYALDSIRNLFIAGCGKAAAPMAFAAQEILGARITGGLVIVKYGHKRPLEKIEIVEAGHPIPDIAGVQGARRLIDLARRCRREDLLLFLLSGGASALFACPANGLSLEDKQQATDALLKSGATIHEINAVRKHISQVKGGRLAQLTAPARLIGLMLSDVVDDAPETIGSGPTAPDRTTYADCLQVIHRYDLSRRMPPAILDYLSRGARQEIAETPKRFDRIFENVQNVIVGNNRLALAAARARAEALGYRAWMSTEPMQGESRVAAKRHAALVKDVIRTGEPVLRPACLLSGGETTVTVVGSGQGGRNQEFALAAAMEIENLDGVVILSGGTDGTDGPTEAAGGIVDGATIRRGKGKQLDAEKFLARNDSYNFLHASDDLLITGPTLTNVMDLQITLIA
jgi:glycerate 2-kinase